MATRRIISFLSLGFLTLSVVFFQNCGQELSVVRISSINNLSFPQCEGIRTLNKPQPSSVTTNEQRPFDVESFLGKTHLENNEELAVSINTHCWQEQKSIIKNFITDQIKIPERSKSMSAIFNIKVKVPRTMSTSEVQASVEETSCLEGVSLEQESTNLAIGGGTPIPTDPRYAEQNHLIRMGHNLSYAGFFNAAENQADTVIAVIDGTGVDILHEDLMGSIWQNEVEVAHGPNNIDDDGNGYVDDFNGYGFDLNTGNIFVYASHGTYIAGLAAATTNNGRGIAGSMSHNAKLMILQASGTTSISNSFRYAADMGAKIIILSTAMSPSETIRSSLEYAVSKGATLFIAAGNSSNNTIAYPAAYAKNIPGVLAIGSWNTAPVVGSEIKCDHSSFDPTFVIAAPGCDSSQTNGALLSTFGDSTGQSHSNYGYNLGTSFAAPLAAGAAASAFGLVRDKYGCELTPAQLETLVVNGARSHSSLQEYFYQGKTIDTNLLLEEVRRVFE